VIKPYYDDGKGIQIFLGDCRAILPSLPKADLVLTDPPYGINYRPDYGNRRMPNGSRMFRTSMPAVIGDDLEFDPASTLSAGNEAIIWGGSHFSERLPKAGSWLIWDKRCQIVPPRCQADAELAWCSVSQVDRIFYHLWDGMLKASERGEPRKHPTQKPVELMRWCLSLVPDAQTVVDPFMGSGTTLRAAKDLGRKVIGIEICEAYAEIAARRLQQEVFTLA
jgi:site-specific DNA-methyltransferase (adenine-specific)